MKENGWFSAYERLLPPPKEALRVVERFNPRHVVRIERKREYIEVLLHVCRFGGSRNDHKARLHEESERDLGDGPLMPLRDRFQNGISKYLVFP